MTQHDLAFEMDPRADRNPFERWLFVVFIIQGLALVAWGAQPGSITVILPGWAQFLWGAAISVGASVALFGMYWPWDPFTGILVKQAGLSMLGIATLYYAVALGLYSWDRGTFGSATFAMALALSLGGACLELVVQNYRYIDRVIARLNTARGGEAGDG